MKKRSFVFLGTGASIGIPVIGCQCSVCTSKDPKNQRMRVSGLIKVGEDAFLIDCGPDMRTQILKEGMSKITGLLVTHTHFDHIAGLDDLRPFCFGRKDPIPCLLSKESFKDLGRRYHYLMQELGPLETPYTKLQFQIVPSDFGSCIFEGYEWQYVSYSQQGMQVTGYRLGDFAYISDIRHYSQEVVSYLQGVRILVVGALRETPSQAHFSVDEAIAFGNNVGAKVTYLTHIGHELDHKTIAAKLPQGVYVAYDGLEIEL